MLNTKLQNSNSLDKMSDHSKFNKHTTFTALIFDRCMNSLDPGFDLRLDLGFILRLRLKPILDLS
jgi:hypothetical protein